MIMIGQVSHFAQECPVCGRPVWVGSGHVGRRACCEPGRGAFVASNPHCKRSGADRYGSLLRGAERRLARTATPRGPKVLLVEYRDEIFARVATDLAQAGLRVIRATSAPEAIERHASHRPILAIVNRDLPDESGWLLVAKLHLAAPADRVWVYQPSRSAADVAMARFLGVDAMVDYRGDLLRLSDAILDCLAGRETPPPRAVLPRSATGADAA